MTPGGKRPPGVTLNCAECKGSIARRRQSRARWRWRRHFSIGRCHGGIRFAVDALHADIVHQMMQRGLNLLQLRLDSALANLAELSPAPTWDLSLHVMEHPVHVVQAPSNLGPVALVLFDVDVFRRIQDLIGGPIRLGKSGVVLVVVMQVQAKLIRKPLQAAGQVINMRVGTKFDLDRLGRNVAARLVHVLRYVIMIAVVEVVRAMVMRVEMRHDEIPIRVMPIGMVPIEMRIMVVDVMVTVVVVVVIP